MRCWTASRTANRRPSISSPPDGKVVSVLVRAATPADIADLIDLLARLFNLEADFQPDAELQRRGLELLLQSEAAVVLVAEVSGSVVAMATAQQIVSTAEGGPALLVEDVVVHEHHRRLGIGSALLAALAEWGHSRGANRLQLLADLDNAPALDFYRRTGWHQTRLICLRRYGNP